MATTAFYAWQSDTPKDLTRYFIRDAIEGAIKKLRAEVGVDDAPALDHDTKGLPGTPAIAESIREKIRNCGVFIGDVSYVATYQTADGRTKRTPNPNVAIELGAAMESVGWDRILLIQNAAFGPSTDLPFDLQHRSFPISYELASADDPRFKDKQKKLTEQIAAKLKLILQDVIAAQRAEREAAERAASEASLARANDAREQFERLAVSGEFRQFPKGDHPILTASLIPLNLPQAPIDLHSRWTDITEWLRPLSADGFDPEMFGKSLVTTTGRKGKITGVSELTQSGSVYAATRLDPAINPPGTNAIPFWGYEGDLLERVRQYIKLLRSVLHVEGPFAFGLSLHRVGGLTLLPDQHSNLKYYRTFLRTLGQDTIVSDTLLIQDDTDPDAPARIRLAVKPALDHLWRECGLEHDPFLAGSRLP